MQILAAFALLVGLAADPPSDDSQRGSAPTPAQTNRAADNAQRGSRGSTAGGDERTGPPAAGIESGDANGLAGGRTDEGPQGGTGVREGGDRIRRDQARARSDDQARRRNKKGSFERPADSPPDINRDPKPIGSGTSPEAAREAVGPEGRNYREGPQPGAAGGVASGTDESPGGSSPKGTAGKGAGTQPDKKQTGSEPDAPR